MNSPSTKSCGIVGQLLHMHSRMVLLTLVVQYGITVKEKGSAGFKKERRNVYPPN